MSKLAIIFPGIGYHTDKPLLYYSKKLAKEKGYEVVEVSYHDLPSGIKGDPKKMYAAYEMACAQVAEQLKDVEFNRYGSVICISKSIGTAIAATIDAKFSLGAKHIYLTPVPQTMDVVRPGSGVVFHGLDDSWCPNEILTERCKELGIKQYTYEQGSHSIETGDTMKDLEYLAQIMGVIEGLI